MKSTLLLPLLLSSGLIGCATTVVYPFEHPAPIEELLKAEQYVAAVVRLPEGQLNSVCGYGGSAVVLGGLEAYGCYRPSDSTIYIRSTIDELNARATYLHELGHVYDQYFLGKSFQQSGAHEGWIRH